MASTINQDYLGTRNIRKLLLEQSIPAAIGILVLSIYTLVDTIFIGRYTGSVGIAAVTIISPISFLVSSLGLGIGIGGAALVSIALGKGERNDARWIFGNQIGLVILIGLLVQLAGFSFFDQIITAFGAKGEVHTAAGEYFVFTLVGLPFLMGQMVFNNVLRAEGRSREAMLVLLLPSLLNIALDALFIVQMGMGLQGAALATAISQFVGSVIGLSLFFKGKDSLLPGFSDLFSTKHFKGIASLGSVQFLSQGAMSVVVLIANHMLFKHGGDLAISAYGLVLRIMMFAFFPVIGIVQGVMPIIGFNFGASRNDRVKESITLAFRTSTIIGIVVSALAFLIARGIISVFTTESDLIALGTIALYWFFSAFPLLGIQQISTSYFQAIGRAKPALLLSLSKQFILIPLLFLLPTFFGLDGIWYGVPTAEVLSTIIAFAFFKRELSNQDKLHPITSNSTSYESVSQS